MSQRAENNFRLELYGELNDIVSAMKNLAQVELHRVAKAESLQQAAFSTTLQAMAALASGYPDIFEPTSGRNLLILLGSERGFCGGFNEQVARHFAAAEVDADRVLVVGSRLAVKLDDSVPVQLFTAPSTVDEVLPCVQQILDLMARQTLPARVNLLVHGRAGIEQVALLPRPALPQNPSPRIPVLTLPSAVLREELQWQCLYQGLMLYLLGSLKTENRMRLQQMEGAREHLEALTRALRLRINALRQQEIVEEIEVILSLGEQS